MTAAQEQPITAPGESRGAYGMALPDLPGQRWLTPAAATWPRWSVTQQVGPPPPMRHVDVKRELLATTSYGAVHIDRTTQTTTIFTADPFPDAAFVHPLLTLTAVVHAEWSGRLGFHAGALLAAGGAWGVLGERQDGKSSALAWLVRHGVPVLSDDLLVTDGDRVCAGPRCIDLRESAATHFRAGEELGRVGHRNRWRLDLAPVEPEAPLAGWVVLAWGDGPPRVDRVATRAAVQRLSDQRGTAIVGDHPLAWLAAASKPMVRLTRPQSWETMAEAMTLLIDTLNGDRQPGPATG